MTWSSIINEYLAGKSLSCKKTGIDHTNGKSLCSMPWVLEIIFTSLRFSAIEPYKALHKKYMTWLAYEYILFYSVFCSENITTDVTSSTLKIWPGNLTQQSVDTNVGGLYTLVNLYIFALQIKVVFVEI